MPRSLPKKNNPHILSGEAPPYEELLARRRLGKTNLVVKETQIGTSNATKPENLGPFEYAHLRAPLPKDLKGSEIFPSHTPQQHPETYFLMRRSKDGYVSATGMFKIAFPWAKLDEERAERDYLKTRDETSEDEIAGNVWISPSLALDLAKDYKMHDWVRALLDPTEIQPQPNAKKHITPPPKFELPPLDAPSLPAATRTRSRRSASPSKKAVSPRKPRQTRAMKEFGTPGTTAANESLQTSLDITASTTEGPAVNGTVTTVEAEGEKTPASGKAKRKAEKSKKAVDTLVETEEREEVTIKEESEGDVGKKAEAPKGDVAVELPTILPEGPSAAETEEMIAKAKENVQEAATVQEAEDKTSRSPAGKPSKKRKTDELSEDEEDDEASAQRVKRVRVLEDKLKRERVRNRALFGVTAAFALAASIPYFF